MEAQNYRNHVRRVPLFSAAALILFLTILGASVNLYLSRADHQRLYSASLILVVSIIVLLTLFFARVFALKAQDRAIRAEEALRHFILTGKPLDSRLSVHQIAALRFASDDEFPALAASAAEHNTKPDDIKRAVRYWRPDHHRV
jgi:L-asparagine transporter-like permease